MITDERKQALMQHVESEVERWIRKTDLFAEAMYDMVIDEEEREFLMNCQAYYTVEE